MSEIIIVILFFLYIYLGDKSIRFLKRNILHVEDMFIFSISHWLLHRAVWAFLFGWITIPIAGIMFIFGVRG